MESVCNSVGGDIPVMIGAAVLYYWIPGGHGIGLQKDVESFARSRRQATTIVFVRGSENEQRFLPASEDGFCPIGLIRNHVPTTSIIAP